MAILDALPLPVLASRSKSALLVCSSAPRALIKAKLILSQVQLKLQLRERETYIVRARARRICLCALSDTPPSLFLLADPRPHHESQPPNTSQTGWGLRSSYPAKLLNLNPSRTQGLASPAVLSCRPRVLRARAPETASATVYEGRAIAPARTTGLKQRWSPTALLKERWEVPPRLRQKRWPHDLCDSAGIAW